MGAVPELKYGPNSIRTSDDSLCLTDMWRAAGEIESKSPAQWQKLPQAIDFIGYISQTMGKSHNKLVFTKVGRGGGTWAHWQIGLAYAKYLSAEFHTWCNEVVRDRMEGKLVPAGAATLSERDLERLTEQTKQIIAPVIDGLHALTERVDSLEKNLPQRRNILPKTKDVIIKVLQALGRRCPCCGLVEVIDENGKVVNAEFDHFFSNQLPSQKHAWLICKPCHDALTAGKLDRVDTDAHFVSFQRHLRKLSLSDDAAAKIEAKS